MSEIPKPTRRPRPQPKGRRAGPETRVRLDAVLGAIPQRRDLLIEHLHRIQDSLGHLPADLLAALAEALSLSAVEVYEVASFYHHFDLVREDARPPPAVTVRVCDSIGCALAGAEALAEGLPASLGPEVRVQRVSCVGRCDAAPIAVVGRRPLPAATPDRIADAIKAGELEDRVPAAEDYHAYRTTGGYRFLRALTLHASDERREWVIAEIERSELRGLGGAGFPAGRKWRIVRAQPSPRLMAVNLDEGEPGTFKDRHYLETRPHRFLDGMLIAANAVGVEAIYVYLRDEYAGCRALLERELHRLRADPPCPIPPIELRRGAGAYVCGEESAMIESIEGGRGLPRLRPPYVAERGLFGRPTLVHNLETLHWVPEILQRGADWFLSHGRNGRRGLRTFSLSGRVNRPGVYVAPAGISASELIDEYGGGLPAGKRLKAYFPGGASGGILPASLADLPLDFDSLQEYGCFVGSAAVIVLAEGDSVRAAALNAMRFFARESCGQCTPCRVGCDRAARLMAAPDWDLPALEDLATVLADASICGLGQAAPNPLRCLIRYFPEELGR